MAQFTLFDKLGVPLKVRFDLAAITEAEAILGMGLYRASSELNGPRFLMTMLWCGSKWDRREMSMNDLFKLVDKAIRAKRVTMHEIQTFIFRELSKSGAMSGFQYDADEDEGSENPTKD